MEQEKHGIETLKAMAMWGISLTEQLEETFEDKKFRWFEIFGFTDELKALAELIPQIDQAGKEFKDLSLDEKNELVVYVGTQLELNSELAEELTQRALDLAMTIYLGRQTIKKIKDFKKARKA